ncbi:hypothetical protein S7711_03022 [Stachybotrys chartarum IBT 7711]|uniref:Large ribosomal subunit protein mL67 n=1 Tax=Stachybotrys chartarum (strain CBS 109288 / IBT 7711) TaxID=1280523 RepID=A0A084APD3_STACB|nr:hypothetical protein S7711_03022 [Stachybotrys chartarum IBT 7711]KFA46759.1 hypothetical protein S40293_06794 [Stachybotrys chartarum IBT 40293]KFA74946.1 hypothetical protein S40288_02236 [Stachybotrys chartarum IBT 40288]
MNATPGFRLGQLPSLAKTWVRSIHTGKRRRQTTGFQGPEGHGENIWVFAHRRSDQVIYSFDRVLDPVQHLKQLPFNGKKTKPAKLRKDYWYPMAHIQFASGQGGVGRSVFQKLRELKHLHEVAWPEELRQKTAEEYTDKDKKMIEEWAAKGRNYIPYRSKLERGRALNAQKPNAIADMAVVLAGQGRGNKVLLSNSNEQEAQLAGVTIRWSNDQDKEYATEWTGNVTHEILDKSTLATRRDSATNTKVTASANKATPEASQ